MWTVVCLAAALSVACAQSSLAGSIISEERTMREHEIAPMRPSGSVSPLDGEPRHENLLDTIDVYALSPHARLLALPRMVPPHMSRRGGGRVAFPNAAEWERLSFGPGDMGRAGKQPASGASGMWADIIKRSAMEHDLPPELVAAVIRVESDFDPGVVSHKGAKGLMQLMPVTQREVGVEDPFDPEANVRGGCAYLRRQLDRFGSLELALAAYNAGPGAVMKYNGIPPYNETINYVGKVLRYFGQ